MFKTEERAVDYERNVLSHRSTNTIGHLFPIWQEILWPKDISRDPCVRSRVKEVTELLGKDLTIRSIDSAKIEELRLALTAKGNKINTVANKLNALSKLLTHGVKTKQIDYVPHFEVPRDHSVDRTYVLTEEEEDRLISALPLRWQAFAIFLSDTASRGFTECQALRWQNINWETRDCTFHKTKTGKPRTIRLSADALAILRELQRQGWEAPWAILGTEGYSTRIWHQTWQLALAKAGLPKGEVVPYTFRHTRATRLARTKMDVLKLADYLGHSNLTTTRRYVHQDASDQDEFVKKLERKRNIG
jgi:integrase